MWPTRCVFDTIYDYISVNKPDLYYILMFVTKDMLNVLVCDPIDVNYDYMWSGPRYHESVDMGLYFISF